jgi:ABC-2 type transport system ATP-binding protein
VAVIRSYLTISRVTCDVTAIRADGVAKSYGDVQALTDLSLSVEPGDLFGVLGPNGAGKTTTMEILTGQLAPDAGDVEVLGIDPTEDPVGVRRRVGILPEQASPPSFLTPSEYFSFVGRVRALPAATVESRVAEWADRLSFRATLDTLCSDLSRGQQQKVMITAAFLHEPEAVFIDEPLANLDPIVQETVKEFLASYRAAGNALFLSTHHIGVAESLCSRVAIVAGGRVQRERRPAELGEDSLLDEFLANVE